MNYFTFIKYWVKENLFGLFFRSKNNNQNTPFSDKLPLFEIKVYAGNGGHVVQIISNDIDEGTNSETYIVGDNGESISSYIANLVSEKY